MRDRLGRPLDRSLRGLAGGDRLLAGSKRGRSASQPSGIPPGTDHLEQRRLLGERPAVGVESLLPLGLEPAATCAALAEVRQRLLGHVEVLVRVPAVRLLGQPHLVLAERRAVRGRRVLLVRTAVADVGADHDQRRAVLDRHRRACRGLERVQRQVVADVLDVPPVRLVALRHVLGDHRRGRARQLDLVVVEECDQPAEAEVPGERGGLGGDALLRCRRPRRS